MKRAQKKAPAPAPTGARAGNQLLRGERFTPLYIDPFTAAIVPTDVREACDRELDRRLCNLTRVARGAA